jgi:hypothetical protein
MDIAFIVIGGILLAAGIYAVYDSNKPASGVRARNDKGRYVKDDPATKHRNEAYKDGKTPSKKKAPVKRKPAAKKPAAKKAPAKKTVAKKAPAKRRTRKTAAK